MGFQVDTLNDLPLPIIPKQHLEALFDAAAAACSALFELLSKQNPLYLAVTADMTDAADGFLFPPTRYPAHYIV